MSTSQSSSYLLLCIKKIFVDIRNKLHDYLSCYCLHVVSLDEKIVPPFCRLMG
jgi:hypothetical protein